MPVHFEPAEMLARRTAAARTLETSGLDGLLAFKQESMYYLTGYDSFGYSLFQCLVLGADGATSLLTRLPDLRQARFTSDIEDVRIWRDREGVDPALELRDLVVARGLAGSRLGIELDSYGLKASDWLRVERALDGVVELVDASTLVDRLRAVKSAREIEYVRRAAALADEALEQAFALTRPGADEAEILAAMQGAVLRGGGDYAGNEFIIGSGPAALLVRYHTGRRRLGEQDQLTLEFAGAYRRYHAALMRTLVVGEPDPAHRRMHAACEAALAACSERLRPGVTMGEVFDAHAEVMDAAGYRDSRLEACGYGMGAVYAPIWVDPPMFHTGNPRLIEAGNVFFLHMILVDSAAGRAMTLGHTLLVTASGNEPLSRAPLGLMA